MKGKGKVKERKGGKGEAMKGKEREGREELLATQRRDGVSLDFCYVFL